MKNVTLAYPNRCDQGSLSGGSWQATLPLVNLKERRQSKLARSIDATLGGTQFIIDLGAAASVGCVALIAHNLDVNAKVRIYGSDANDFTSVIYDSGWQNVWPTGQIDQSLLEWEDDNFWLGTLSANAVAGYKAPFAHYLPTAQNLRYWKIAIDNTANADGTISLGRLFIGPVFTPTHNMNYGMSLGNTDTTAIETSLTGEEFFDIRQTFRTHKFELEFLTGTEAYSNVVDMQRQLGISGELFISGDPDDTINQPRRAFLGRMVSLNPVAQPNYNTYSTQFEVREII